MIPPPPSHKADGLADNNKIINNINVDGGDCKIISYFPVMEDGSLCCCEYFDIHQERNHILACCCNCEDLDESFER